jgi:hypothetical protein
VNVDRLAEIKERHLGWQLGVSQTADDIRWMITEIERLRAEIRRIRAARDADARLDLMEEARTERPSRRRR